MNIDDMIALLQASKDGRTIQRKGHGCVEWRDIDCPQWNFYDIWEYRVKPEPREWTVRISDDGTYIESPSYSSSSTENTVKVREVLE